MLRQSTQNRAEVPRRRYRGLLWLVALFAAAGGGGWLQLQHMSARATSTHHPLGLARLRALRPDVTDQCDVMVVGGTPSGIAAAIAAARRGASVMLVESRPHLGGDITYAMLNMFDVPTANGKPAPVPGIFSSFFKELGIAFDVNHGRRAFETAVAKEPNIRTFLSTRVISIIKDDDRVVAVTLRGSETTETGQLQERTVAIGTVIDATNDAFFAARAGVSYDVGRETANPDKRMQAAGLLFSVAGVDWKAVCDYARGTRPVTQNDLNHNKMPNDAIVHTAPPGSTLQSPGVFRVKDKGGSHLYQAVVRRGGADANYVWERGDVVKGYVPHGPDVLVLSINFGRQGDGTVVLNALNLVNVDALDPDSLEHGHAEALAEIPYLVGYLRGAMPGFANATVARIAPELYIRETRHIHGYYTLTTQDITEQRRFPDRIARASYPLDLHPYTKHDMNPYAPLHFDYTIPLRCLVTPQIDGLFVASRSLSATYSAAGSARVIPVTMAAGEAAGAAAAFCVRMDISPHDLVGDKDSIAALQESLRARGADIGDGPPSSNPAQQLVAQVKVEPNYVAQPVVKGRAAPVPVRMQIS